MEYIKAILEEHGVDMDEVEVIESVEDDEDLVLLEGT